MACDNAVPPPADGCAAAGYVFLAMNMAKRALRAADEFQQQRAWLAFPVAVWKKFGDDQAGNLATLIAYFAFVSIFPLMLVLVTVLDIVSIGGSIGNNACGARALRYGRTADNVVSLDVLTASGERIAARRTDRAGLP